MLNDDLIGLWSFEGDINDSSRNGNVKTVINGRITTDRYGKRNSPVPFNSFIASEAKLNIPYTLCDEFSIARTPQVRKDLC